MTQAGAINNAAGDFGASAKAKLNEDGQPEVQLRNPIEQMFKAFETICQFPEDSVTLVGEKSLAEWRSRRCGSHDDHYILCRQFRLPVPVGVSARKLADRALFHMG